MNTILLDAGWTKIDYSSIDKLLDTLEDRLAAEAAGVQYQHPNEFFGKYIGDKVGDKQ